MHCINLLENDEPAADEATSMEMVRKYFFYVGIGDKSTYYKLN